MEEMTDYRNIVNMIRKLFLFLFFFCIILCEKFFSFTVCFVHRGLFAPVLLIFVLTCLLGVIFFDFPFGLGREEWDQFPLSVEELKTIIRKIQSMSAFPWFRFIAVVRQDLVALYQAALQDLGFGHVHAWYWYKTTHNQEFVSTLSSVEVLLVATYCEKNKNNERKWDGTSSNGRWKSPLERHNHVDLPGVSTVRFLDQNQKVVNRHEKPPALIAEFLDRFLPPGANVLVIGAGSGGEVIGALASRCGDIIALEPDAYQFENLVRRMHRLQSRSQKNPDLKFLADVLQMEGDAAEGDDEPSGKAVLPSCITCGDNFTEEEKKENCYTCGAYFHADRRIRKEICYTEDANGRYCSDACVPKVIVAETQEQ